jgi:hypothetical protein
MNRIATHAAAALLALAVAAPAAASGRAEVRWAEASHFTDAGFGAREIERTQRVLGRHIEQLAQRLPDGQVLTVEVRDVDLAGQLEMFSFDQLRVLGRAPDRPRLDLRFELRAGAEVLQRGDAVLTDLAYLQRGVGVRRGEPLEHERRLLDRWFDEQIASAAR